MSKKVLIIYNLASNTETTGQIYFFLQKKQEILFFSTFFKRKSENIKLFKYITLLLQDTQHQLIKIA